jgi:4-hydroxythreonine-4-phosphate dehydrogenase
LLITMGDAVGIGPEIIVKAFAAGQASDAVVVGDVAAMQRAAARLSWPCLSFRRPMQR